MGSRKSQRAVYLVTAAIVASMVAGFAVAELSLGGTSISYQGSQTTTVSPFGGLTWEYTALSQANVSTAATITTGCGGTQLTACNVYDAPLMICAGAFPPTVPLAPRGTSLSR